MDVRISLRMRGRGAGLIYDTNMKHLQNLPCNVRFLQRIRLFAVGELASAVNLNAAVPILDLLDFVGRLDIHDWFCTTNAIARIGYRFETCPLLNIIHYLLEHLDVSSGTADQDISVIDAPVLREVNLGLNTTSLSISSAQSLGNITVTASQFPLQPKLNALTLLHSNMQLNNIRVFKNLRSLHVEHCRFDGLDGLNPIRALRHSLVHLWFWHNTHDGLDDHEPLVMHFSDFLKLETISIGECHFFERMSIINCPDITDVEIIACSSFLTLRTRDRPGPSIMSGLRKLVTLIVSKCPLVSTFTIINLPRLEEATFLNNCLQDIHVDGDTCPVLTMLELGQNELWDDSCHLNGAFNALVTLGLSRNMFASLPSSWSVNMPYLRCILLGWNCFEDPVDLTVFLHLTKVDLQNNQCPLLDRGGLPFVLRVRVHDSVCLRKNVLVATRAVLVSSGVSIPVARLVLADVGDDTTDQDDDHPMW